MHAKVYSETQVPHRDYTVATVWLPYGIPPGSFGWDDAEALLVAESHRLRHVAH